MVRILTIEETRALIDQAKKGSCRVFKELERRKNQPPIVETDTEKGD